MNKDEWIVILVVYFSGAIIVATYAAKEWLDYPRREFVKRLGPEGRIVLAIGYGFTWPLLLSWGTLVFVAAICVALALGVRAACRGFHQIIAALREPLPKAQMRKERNSE